MSKKVVDISGYEDEEEKVTFLGTHYSSGYFSPSIFSHFANIVNSYTDGSLLAIPFFMRFVGPFWGVLIYVAYSGLMLANIEVLFKTAEMFDYKGRHLHEIAKLVYGKWGEICCISMVSLGQLAVFISGILFTLEYAKNVLCISAGVCYEDSTILIVMLVITMIVALIPTIKHFSFISVVSLVLIIITVVSIFYLSLIGSKEEKLVSKKWLDFDMSWTLVYISVVSYSIEGVGLAFPIRASFLEKRTEGQFKKLYYFTTLLLAVVFVLFGLINFLKFGDKCHSIIFLNYLRNPFLLLIEISYVVSIFVSIGINLFPLTNIIYETKFIMYLEDHSRLGRFWVRYVVRALMTLVCYAYCFIGVTFADFLMLTGGCIFVFLGLVLPSAMYWKVQDKKVHFWVVALGVVGIAVWLGSSYVGIKGYLTGAVEKSA